MCKEEEWQSRSICVLQIDTRTQENNIFGQDRTNNELFTLTDAIRYLWFERKASFLIDTG